MLELPQSQEWEYREVQQSIKGKHKGKLIRPFEKHSA
jgi:hypothetical protein